MKGYTIISLLLLTLNIFGNDNQKKVDSLLQVLPSIKSDTGRISLLIEISNTYRSFETENAVKYCEQALQLSEKINNKEKIYDCYVNKALIDYRLGNNKEAISNFMKVINNAEEYSYSRGKAFVNIGNVYADLGKYDSSIIFYNKSIEVHDEMKDMHSKAGVLNNIGTVYNDLGEFEKAIFYYTEAQKINESIDNKAGAAAAIGNIGIIYYYQKDFDKAIEYLKKGLELNRAIGRFDKVANSLNNLAAMYSQVNQMDSAIKCFEEASLIYENMNHKSGMALMAQNTAHMYFKVKNSKKGIEAMNKAIELYTEMDEPKGIGKCYVGLGQNYTGMKEYNLAIKNFLQAEEILSPLGVKHELRNLYNLTAIAYSENNNHKKSNEYLKKYIAINDSIFNADKNRQAMEMQEKYDSESKEKEIKLQQIEIEKQNAEVAHQTTQKIWFGIGLGLTIILLLLAFRGYKLKQKTNEIIIHQKNIVEEKNKEIIDSINYAKRIQSALLSSEEHESKHLPEHFVYFKPKDIVSGDFYWTLEKQNCLYLAVGDCTGHGVPGAFLTMLGTAFLNEITAREGILSPAQILNELRKKIIKELHQTGKVGENRDGMDMSLIRLDIKTKKLEWAGANNPLWLVKNEAEKENSSLQLSVSANDKFLYEIKSDKQPISYFPNAKPFTNHQINLNEKDSIYLFTDGYADQFGGPKGKKFKYKPFKELLISLSSKSMKEQKESLENNFIQWKGDLEQIDDICVIGLKI